MKVLSLKTESKLLLNSLSSNKLFIKKKKKKFLCSADKKVREFDLENWTRKTEKFLLENITVRNPEDLIVIIPVARKLKNLEFGLIKLEHSA